MFINFLSSLLLLGFAFQLLLIVIAVPIGLLFAALGRNNDSHANALSAIVSQITVSVGYAGFIAVVTAYYAHTRYVEYPLIYVTSGFLVTYITLGSNHYQKYKQASPEQDFAAVRGAGLGVLAGLIAFPIVYAWPGTITVFPGAVPFFRGAIGLADWLSAFLVVRIILGFLVLGYIMQMGIVSIVGGYMALAGTVTTLNAGYAKLKRLLGIGYSR